MSVFLHRRVCDGGCLHWLSRLHQWSSVTRVPMESVPLVKKILPEKEEYCVGRSSALFNTPAFVRYSVIWDRFALMKSSNHAIYRTGVSVWIVVEYDAIDDNYSECQPDKSDSPGNYSSSRYSRVHKETVWPSELGRTSRMFFVAPVALIHWKCFVVLMSALQYLQREEFRVYGRATGDSHSVSDVKSTRMQVSN